MAKPTHTMKKSGKSDKGTSVCFPLPEHMGIESIESTANALSLLPMDDTAGITLDASAIQHITTPAVQLLCVFEKMLVSHGSFLRLANPSTATQSAFSDLGLAEAFTRMTAT